MNWFEKRKVKKFLASLTPEQIEKLKKKLSEGCIHGVRYDAEFPCMSCFSNSVRSGDITIILPWLK